MDPENEIQEDDGEVNEVEEMTKHDPANAPAENTAAVKAAEKKGKPKAKLNKPKSAGSQPAEKVPSEKEGSGLGEETEEESYDFNEDLNALVDEEATLSEGFKDKAAVIFEAALTSALNTEVTRLEENFEEQLTEAKAELVDNVDSYLNYVVEQWMTDNEIAITSGLRNEIAEDFMAGLKGLFEESYIDVPESKVDLVDEIAVAHDEMAEQLNTTTSKLLAVTEELDTYKRFEVIRDLSEGMADTDVERLAKLTTDMDFVDEESFTEKVKTVKEAYFGAKAKKGPAADTDVGLGEHTDEDNGEDAISPQMARYVKAIKQQK